MSLRVINQRGLLSAHLIKHRHMMTIEVINLVSILNSSQKTHLSVWRLKRIVLSLHILADRDFSYVRIHWSIRILNEPIHVILNNSSTLNLFILGNTALTRNPQILRLLLHLSLKWWVTWQITLLVLIHWEIILHFLILLWAVKIWITVFWSLLILPFADMKIHHFLIFIVLNTVMSIVHFLIVCLRLFNRKIITLLTVIHNFTLQVLLLSCERFRSVNHWLFLPNCGSRDVLLVYRSMENGRVSLLLWDLWFRTVRVFFVLVVIILILSLCLNLYLRSRVQGGSLRTALTIIIHAVDRMGLFWIVAFRIIEILTFRMISRTSFWLIVLLFQLLKSMIFLSLPHHCLRILDLNLRLSLRSRSKNIHRNGLSLDFLLFHSRVVRESGRGLI